MSATKKSTKTRTATFALRAVNPPWKDALIQLVDKQTSVPLVEQLASGVITEDVLLFLNLGISSERLGAAGVRINLIIKEHSTKAKKRFLSLDDLATCETLADLIKLVGSRM
ncbi:MAG: hypothetical protein JNM26_09825 [Ideonella sp.]|nr:hypothetical protein [Ideonella sp.]